MVAVAGVSGTLLAPLLAQRAQSRSTAAEFERQERARLMQWRREQVRDELAQRQACYVATNAAFRRYRTQLMEYLWWVHHDVTDTEKRQRLEDARLTHHAALAEAQMIASSDVLDELDEVAKLLSDTYRKIMYLHEGNPEPDGSFEEIGSHLVWLWERWKKMREVMRADLGDSNRSALPSDAAP
ncbi:hypothetical protein [Streptomyces nanshensis]|uniref:hypothetical protein n=1 Tax=Streptomyces nanshensis TaxID=518642 RepID=UPI0014960EA7|nr:hypothetical protein [Streptomyces nanshensis]